MIKNTNAPVPTDAPDSIAAEAARLQVILDAYAPEDCEECEARQGTCWECATDALEEAGYKVITSA